MLIALSNSNAFRRHKIHYLFCHFFYFSRRGLCGGSLNINISRWPPLTFCYYQLKGVFTGGLCGGSLYFYYSDLMKIMIVLCGGSLWGVSVGGLCGGSL